jgi:hypothetical protein
MEKLIETLNEKLSHSLTPETLKEVTETISTAISENVDKIKEKNKKFLFYSKRKLQEDAQKYGNYIAEEKEKEIQDKLVAKEQELSEKAEAYGKYLLDEMTSKAEKYAEYVKEELSKKAEKYAEYVQTESYKDAEKYIVESFVKYVDSIKEDIEKEVKAKSAIINEKKDKEAARLLKEIKALIGYKESGKKVSPVSNRSDELIRRNHVLESKLKEQETTIQKLSENRQVVDIRKRVDEEIAKLPLSKRAEARRKLVSVRDEKELSEKMNTMKESIAKETVKPTVEKTEVRKPVKPLFESKRETASAIPAMNQLKRLTGISN